MHRARAACMVLIAAAGLQFAVAAVGQVPSETPAAAPAGVTSAEPAATAPAPASPVAAPPPPATPAEPAPTRPFVLAADKISAGDTAWMLASTALVLLMTLPGLALFYAGMVRQKNVLATGLQAFTICCVVTLLWVCVGYSLAFTPGSTPFLGSLDRSMLLGMLYLKESGRVSVSHLAATIPESVYVMFQLTFAIITPALVIGAFAERMRFGPMVLFIILWSLVVYVPIAHWV